MSDKEVHLNIDRLRIIANKWREALVPGNNIDPNKLADLTLKAINEEPLIRDICEAFLMSVAITGAKDPNFDSATYVKIKNRNVGKDAKIVKK